MFGAACCWVLVLQVMQPLTPQELETLQKTQKSTLRMLLDKVKRRTDDMQGGVRDR